MTEEIPDGDTDLMTVGKLREVLKTCRQDAIVYLIVENKDTGFVIKSICEKWNSATKEHVLFISSYQWEHPLKDFNGTKQ